MTIQEINHEIEQLEPAEVNVRNVQVLSSLYNIRDHLGMGTTSGVYVIPNINGTEFDKAISGVPLKTLLDILNEHMEVVKVLHPKEYDEIINRLNQSH